MKEIPTVTLRRLAMAATGLTLTALLSACGGTGSGDHSGMGAGGSATSAGARSSADPADSRKGDITFAQAMIPHHEQAIQMADLALEKASSSEVKTLASQIKGAQDPEIRTMNAWLSAWGVDPEAGMDHSGMDHSGMDGMDGMSGMPGMMSDAEMTALGAASGAEFDQMWLQMMIAHHQGAVTMAQDVLATTKDPAVEKLARAVVDGQTQEIDTMKALLAR